MRLNLSSEIVLNKVPLAYYKPKTTVEYSEISRMEKIHTDIFASSMEGAAHVADQVEKEIKAAQHDGIGHRLVAHTYLQGIAEKMRG